MGISTEQVRALDRYFRAANYLTVGQIYLQDNPLLQKPLRPEHIKPRPCGHWGTSPGLNFIYVHLNRLIREQDASVVLLTGPGHGGPAIVANVYLEGTYSELYPQIGQDTTGMLRLFRQFATPGGIPHQVSVQTPGSIHAGGELGYVLAHAFGAVFDHPELLAVAVIGDGEAETGPLEGAWKSVRFLNPVRDGAVLPILHLNGYKLWGPTVLGRATDEDIRKLLEAHGYAVHFVHGDKPLPLHRAFAATLDTCYARIRAIKTAARVHGFTGRPAWPAIVLRTPKGWTGPKVVDGLPMEGTFRAHQLPLTQVKIDSAHRKLLEEWLLSYKPEKLFDPDGRLAPELRALAPQGERRMGSTPYANGGKLAVDLELPDFRDYAVLLTRPATEKYESTRQLGQLLRDLFKTRQQNFRLFSPDETRSHCLGQVFSTENRCSVGTLQPTDEQVTADGRVMEVLSEHLCQGWLEGYLLSGRHGLLATSEAFAMVTSSMTVQHARWLEEAGQLAWRAPIPSLNILLTSTCWRNELCSPQGPGLLDTVLAHSGKAARIYLPPDANCLLAVADHCLRSRNSVNLIVIDKQPQLQWLGMNNAIRHCAARAAIWQWASTAGPGQVADVVLAAAGDLATLEVVAAAWLLRQHAPGLKVHVVNVVDLLSLCPQVGHPHGLLEAEFLRLFPADRPVIFAFHGYPRAIHALLHGRTAAERFHVHGFRESCPTATPFEMVVHNETSRFHLCQEALRHCGYKQAGALQSYCEEMLAKHHRYTRAHFTDLPEIQDWKWT